MADASTARAHTVDEAFTERITVPFEGSGSGHGPLTWGQWGILDTMRKTGSSWPIGGVVPVTPGKAIADLVGEMRFFLSRYPAMRARLRFTPDHEPSQVVAARGETVFGIVDVGEHDDPASAGARLAEQWRQTPFDLEHEWPIRMAAIRHRGVPTHVVVFISHLATDGPGVGVMLRELGQRDPLTGQIASSAPVLGPLELAQRQHEPEMLRQSETALRYWGRLLRKAPLDRFAPPHDRGEPRFVQAEFDSPALYLATRALAPGSLAATGPVLLAAYAVATTRALGISPTLIQMTVNNRFRAELADVSHPICLNGLLHADVADVDFREAVERVRRASFLARKYAYYNPVDLYRLRAAIAQERGREVDLGFLFNDQRAPRPEQDEDQPHAADPAPTAPEIHAALDRRSLSWNPIPLFIERLMLFVRDVPGEMVGLSLQVDTRYVPMQTAEEILLGIESVVVEAACDTSAAPAVYATAGSSR